MRAAARAAGLELVRTPAHLVSLSRPLDLDDASPQVREEAGAVGAGEHAGQVEDDQAREGQVIGAHRRSIADGNPLPSPRPSRSESPEREREPFRCRARGLTLGDQICLSIVSAPLTSNLPGCSTLSAFTTPSSTSME